MISIWFQQYEGLPDKHCCEHQHYSQVDRDLEKRQHDIWVFLIVCWEPELQRRTAWRTWLNVQRCSSEWSACILSWKLQEAFFPEQPEKLMRSMGLLAAKRFVPKVKQIWRMWAKVIRRMNLKWRPWHLWLYCVCRVALRIVWKSNKLWKQNSFRKRHNIIKSLNTWPDEILGELFVPGISVVAWNQLELRKKSSISSWN